MSTTNCGNVSTHVNCNTSGAPEVAFENQTSEEQTAFIEVAPGGVIRNPSGDIIYQNEGNDIEKCRVRIP